MPNLWSSEINRDHSITSKSGVKSGRIGLLLCSIVNMPQFFKKKKTIYKKLVPQTVYTLYQFQIKIYLEPFESIYHLSIFYNLKIILNYWFISKTINIRDNFIRMRLGSLVYLV